MIVNKNKKVVKTTISYNVLAAKEARKVWSLVFCTMLSVVAGEIIKIIDFTLK